MTRNLIPLALTVSFASCFAAAQTPEGGSGIPRLHLLPRGSEATLNLTGEQQKQWANLESESKAKIEKILTPEQLKKLKAMQPPPPPGGQRNRGEGTPPVPANDARGQVLREDSTNAPSKPLPAGFTRIAAVFSGGHEMVPVDHGRPVVLIAAALGVKDEVFREAFSHVHPAGPGRGGPTDAEARANKQALMSRLAQYGITDERLNTVSNFYRYAAWEGGIWKNKAATANALVKDGAIVGYEIVSGGYGYTTPPAVSVPGFAIATAAAELSYGKNFETNGAVSSITPAKSR